MSLRCPTVACFIYFNSFEASLQTLDRLILSLFSDYSFLSVMNDLLACIVNFNFCDRLSDRKLFSVHVYHLLYYTCFHDVCEYIQSTHWLVPGYCLGQIYCLKRSEMTATPEPSYRWEQPCEDRSYPGQLFLWEMESHRRWWPRTASATNH